MKKIIIGKFASTHGLKGHIKVMSFASPESNITLYKDLYILKKSGDFELLDISSFKMITHNKGLLKLEGYDSIESVSGLVNKEIYVDRSSLADLDSDSYYWSDLVDLEVKDLKGNHIGKIDHLFETGSNDVIVVKNADSKDILIPYLKDEVVIKVSLSENYMVVDWDYLAS